MKSSIKRNNKKPFWPYYIIVGICGIIVIGILVGIINVILFLNSLSQSASQAEKTNEAKKLIIPVESYAQSQGWKSVFVFNDPGGGDNSVPNFDEAFITTQTPIEVERDMTTFLNKIGYHLDSQTPSPSQNVYPSQANDSSDIDLHGTATNGNDVYVTISTKQYPNGDNSLANVPRDKTSVYVEFDYNGYVIQMQNETPPSNISCVGSGCSK